MNGNPDMLVKVAPKAEGLQGWQVRLLVVDCFVLVAD